MFDIIAIPFGYLMYWCYQFIENYGVALILFTLITKILLFPLSIKQQKSTAKQQLLAPKLEKIRKKCGNDRNKFTEEQMKLYSEEGVSPTAGCLPLLIQLPIIYGLFNVIYRPLTFILRFSEETINAAKAIITENPDVFDYVNTSLLKSRPEVSIFSAVVKNPEMFLEKMGADFVSKVSGFDFSFLGINLADTPTFAFNLLILIPIASFLSNLGFTIYSQMKQKKNNPTGAQMPGGMNAVMYIMPVISAVMTFSFPAGIGLYWTYSSLFGLLQAVILNNLYSPKKMALVMEKEKAKPRKKSMYQRMLDAQNAANGVAPTSTVTDDDKKLSKSANKELQRERLNAARKRMAEKYGDDYNDAE